MAIGEYWATRGYPWLLVNTGQPVAINLLNAVLVKFKKNKQGVQVSPASIQRAIGLLVLPK